MEIPSPHPRPDLFGNIRIELVDFTEFYKFVKKRQIYIFRILVIKVTNFIEILQIFMDILLICQNQILHLSKNGTGFIWTNFKRILLGTNFTLVNNVS